MSAPASIPAASYSVDYVNGKERVPVFNYNRATRVFTATSFASGRASISSDGSGVNSISIGGTAVFAIVSGVVQVAGFSYLRSPEARAEARLEFVRHAERGRQVIGTLTDAGVLAAWRFNEGAVPDTTDHMELRENIAALGAGGLYCPAGFVET